MKLRLKSILLAASFMLAPAAQAAGLIVIDPVPGMPVMPVIPVHPIRPGHPTTPHPVRPLLKGSVSFGLRLQAADVKVEIVDQVAKTYITQTFCNDTDRNLAGTYLFPLPDDTVFSSFSLHIDGKPIEGKILAAQEARQQYEEIVRRMVDPGLLEYADYKTVRARIFPIPAHGTKKVELEYTQVLKAENGLLQYRFPLKTEGETAAVDDIKVNVKLSSKQGLRTIWSPSHTITLDKTNDHLAKVAYLGKDTVPEKDFMLYYSVSDKELSANVLTHKDTDEDGYYLLTVTPPVETKQIGSKDIVLVVDTSGSMEGKRMEQNKKALKYLVNALNANDHFSIVEFNTDVEHFKSNLVQATPENKKEAVAFIDDLEARGGTNLADALKNALTMLDHPSENPGYLVLMTDGEPTVGETGVPALLKSVHPKRDLRVFDFGVGYDVNTRLLNKLADEHHGTAQYVEPEESLETAMASFYQKIKTPVLSNVKIAYEGVQPKDVYPREVKDIFAGSQVLLIGKYKGSGKATVKLTGTVNGVQKAYSFPVSFASSEAGHTYLPRLWAMRRIGHLTDVAQENGNNQEVVDEIVALSKKYGIISQYTSFLVTDPNDTMQNVRRMQPPTAMPMSSSRAGAGGARGVSGRMMSFAHNAPSQLAMVDGFVTDWGGSKAEREETRDKKQAFMAAKPAEASDMIKNKMSIWNAAPANGKEAVMRAKKLDAFKGMTALSKDNDSDVKTVEGKTFYLRNGFWTDAALDPKAKLETITFGSKQYFEVVHSAPGIAKFFAVGRQVIVMFNGHAYKVVFSEDA